MKETDDNRWHSSVDFSRWLADAENSEINSTCKFSACVGSLIVWNNTPWFQNYWTRYFNAACFSGKTENLMNSKTVRMYIVTMIWPLLQVWRVGRLIRVHGPRSCVSARYYQKTRQHTAEWVRPTFVDYPVRNEVDRPRWASRHNILFDLSFWECRNGPKDKTPFCRYPVLVGPAISPRSTPPLILPGSWRNLLSWIRL